MDRLKARFPIYSRLLRLYPLDYQHKYDEQMLQTLADMLDDPERTKVAVWLRTAFDLPVSVSKQQLIYVGATMTHDNPNYMKRNALLSAILLLPFPAAIIFNKFVPSAFGPTSNWAMVAAWTFIYLPAIAFLIGSSTFLYWLIEQRRQARSHFWKRVLDIRRIWAVIIITGLSLGMALFLPFHDSVHCVTSNPIHKITYLRQTWHCIQQSR